MLNCIENGLQNILTTSIPKAGTYSTHSHYTKGKEENQLRPFEIKKKLFIYQFKNVVHISIFTKQQKNNSKQFHRSVYLKLIKKCAGVLPDADRLRNV